MKEKLLELLEAEVEPPYKQALKRLVRPYIRIRTKKSPGHFEVGASRIGGYPDMPIGSAWPYDQERTHPMQFVGQFNLEDLKKHDEESLLPKAGLLQFFSCFDECFVTLVQADKSGLAGTKPPAPLEPAKKSFFSRIFRPKPIRLSFDACSLEFFKEYSVPSWDSIYADMIEIETSSKIKPIEAYSETFLNQDADLRDSGDNKTNHHFLGYTDGIQNSYKEMEVADPSYVGHRKPARDDYTEFSKWILLLQIDTDGNAGMMWGDAGRLYFMIKKEDLRNGDFSNVKLAMDCY